MNAKQWVGCKDAQQIWEQICATERKSLLLLCAYLRKIKNQAGEEGEQVFWAVDATELFADGQISNEVWKTSYDIAIINIVYRNDSSELFKTFFEHLSRVQFIIREAVVSELRNQMKSLEKYSRQKKKIFSDLADLVRCLFSNPFLPQSAVNPNWLLWHEGVVKKMAEAIYENRKFEDLPILADALEDAGCTDGNLLGHCRGPGPHAKGCWVLDLLLGKQ